MRIAGFGSSETDFRGAHVELGRRADPEVGAERAGDLVAEVGADAAAADAAHQLADEPAEAQRVIAVLRARLPPRRLRGVGARHGVPVEERRGRQRRVDGDEPRAVVEQPAHGDRSLVRLRELGPVARHRRVEVELALVCEPVRAERGHALRGREQVHDRVGRPGARAGRVRVAAPEVDHAPAVERDGHRGAELLGVRELLGEERRARRRSAGRRFLRCGSRKWWTLQRRTHIRADHADRRKQWLVNRALAVRCSSWWRRGTESNHHGARSRSRRPIAVPNPSPSPGRAAGRPSAPSAGACGAAPRCAERRSRASDRFAIRSHSTARS